MRVALDLTPALSGLTGVARYSRALAAGLTEIGVEVKGYAVGRGPGELPPGTRHLPIPLRIVAPVASRFGVPRVESLAAGSDVAHSLDLMPLPTRLPLVATAHDLAAIERPDLHPAQHLAEARRRLEAMAAANIVVAVSQTTRGALVRAGLDADRIVVAPLAAIRFTGQPVAPSDPRPFILAVGEITPRKDYPTLLGALSLEPARDLRLVIAGPIGFRGGEVIALANSLGITNRVRFAGHVSDAELAGLYAHATALCLPSVIEGFGIPLVEAMAVGLPIVAADIEAVREVTDTASVRVASGDAEGFAVALQQVATDPVLRADLGERGRCRAGEFSWRQTATATLHAYQRALECG